MTRRARVTGFGAFGAVADNPSGAVAAAVALRLSVLGWDARAETLRVTFDEARAAPSRLAAESPELLLHVGVAESRRALCLERCARNLVGARADVDGRAAVGPLDPAGPPRRDTTLALDALAAAWRAPLDVEVSDDCGDYVCNATYWAALGMAAARSGLVALFVHVPPMSREIAVASGESLADALALTVSRAS